MAKFYCSKLALFCICDKWRYLFAYLFNIYGISVIGASATGSYIYTQPVFAAIIAMVFTGETYDWLKLAAAILIFSGVYMVNYKPQTI